MGVATKWQRGELQQPQWNVSVCHCDVFHILLRMSGVSVIAIKGNI